MKIQTSRDSHRAENRYSGVYQQQGRMITDADWNELMEIVTERRRESLGDVVQSGIPRDGGVGISFVNGKLTIGAGHLYAGGTLARLPEERPFDDQVDFQEAPGLPPAPYKLYADVWERPLTSLEDGAVRDAALHGADTCARAQTMVQIKWCPESIEPEKPEDNPPCGDAPLTLTLRQSLATSDPCDPCAAEELGEDPTRIGNYLFRVEVHDVKQAADGTINQLILKWSSENGAEQYLYDNAPKAFQVDGWVFERFSDVTEHQLGVHFARNGGTFPRRGELLTAYPPAADDKHPYVRRWDGYVVMNHNGGWSIDADHAVDRGLDLGEVVTNSNTHGEVVLSGNTCTINLDSIELKLDLDHVFVAGDYWTAPVREATAVDDASKKVLSASPPTGIMHHYLMLGRVTLNGAGPEIADDPATDLTHRRLNFPSLTTLLARDVGYDPNQQPDRWKDISELPAAGAPLTSPANVQEAIDTLVQNLESSDIGYNLPACTADPGKPPLFKDLVKDLFDPSGKTDVKELWDELLCHLNAGRIPYDPTSTSGRWTEITDVDEPHLGPPPNTVQGAIDTLVDNLESSDIGYRIPPCTADANAPPLLKDLLGMASGTPTDVKRLWDEILCRLSAATVPVDKDPPLVSPLNVPTVRSVQDALNVLAARRGRGGLAGVLKDLADAIGINADDPRRTALIDAPVSGEQSLAEATYGMVVDLLRIAAAFALEYIDLKGIVFTPEGELRIGSSASVNLFGTIRPDARAFAMDQIKARTDLWAGLRAGFKNVFWCVLAEFLTAKGVHPQAVQQMGAVYGGTGGYNGPAARVAFLENVYRPLFGKTDLDHTTLVTLRSLILEFIARLWKRITVDILIQDPPAFTDCPTEWRWLQSDPVQRVWKRVRDQDGLMRFHPTPGGAPATPVAPRLSMERVGRGSTWIARDDSIERYLHPPVVEPLLPPALRQGGLCPEPHVVLQCLARFRVAHVAPAVYAGSPALEVLFANLMANVMQLTVVDVGKLPAGAPPISAPANLPLLRKALTLPNDCHMVLGDGRHSPVAHQQRQFATSATGEGMESIDLFLVAEDPLNQRMLYTESGDGVVQAVYHLTRAAADPLPSHGVLVESSAGRQRLILFAGNGIPWWGPIPAPGTTTPPPPLRAVAHVALHPDVTVAGVAHDQLVLQVVQPGSPGGPKWTFVPFRTFAESLWGQDRFALGGYWNTAHPDGAPLFESLDGSVTPSIAPANIMTVLDTPLFGGPLVGTVAPQPMVVGPQPPIVGPQPPIVGPQPPIVGPHPPIVGSQPPIVAPPPDLPIMPLAVQGGPLVLFDGVVRRAGPAGLNGWLTVLAEDEILGLYRTFQGLLPKQARRYHVNNAVAALATVIDNNLILIGDVTDQALQFDLGSMVKA
jgi:hypothetical protein